MKRLWKIIAIGVCIGLVSVVLQKALHIDRDVFLRWYWVTAAAVVLGAVLVNVVYNVFYQKKMQRLVPLLEAQKPREYIAGVEQLLKTAKGQNLRNILMMNLCTCYFQTGQGEKALMLYRDSQSIFEPQRKGGLYSGNIAILDILAAIQNKEYSQAEQLLDEARQRWEAPRFQEAFQEIEGTLAEIKKEGTL